jgi:hypothetical protein
MVKIMVSFLLQHRFSQINAMPFLCDFPANEREGIYPLMYPDKTTDVIS